MFDNFNLKTYHIIVLLIIGIALIFLVRDMLNLIIFLLPFLLVGGGVYYLFFNKGK